MPRGNPSFVAWRDYRLEVARLDAISRTRALTDAESLLLERYLARVGRKSIHSPHGNTKELARLGIKRQQADKQPRQAWCDQCSPPSRRRKPSAASGPSARARPRFRER